MARRSLSAHLLYSRFGVLIQMVFELSTPRLRLVAVTAALAAAEIKGELGASLGAQIPEAWPPDELDEIAVVFMQLLRKEPTLRGFLGWYWVLQTPEPTLIGMGGFKGHPDESGFVEIGYSVLPEHQGQGFATEAVEALLGWARRFEEICGVLAFTKTTNLASRRVLERQRFTLTEEVLRDGEPMCAYLRTWSGD